MQDSTECFSGSAVPPIGNSAVFLDRDGVIDRAIIRGGRPCPPTCLTELEIPSGVRESLDRLKNAGYLLLVVTNQPDVARHHTSVRTVEAINEELKRNLPLDDIFVCYHDDNDDCSCRKPKPGLLLSAARAWKVSLPNSVMIGDRWKDIEAGRRAGCKTILLDSDYAEISKSVPDFRSKSLPEATNWILAHKTIA